METWPKIRQVQVFTRNGYGEQREEYTGKPFKRLWWWVNPFPDDAYAHERYAHERVYNIDTPLRRMTASIGPLSTDLLYTFELEHWDKVITFSPRKISFRIMKDAGEDLAGGKPWVRLVTTKEGKHGPPYDERYSRAIVMLKDWGQLKNNKYFIAGWNAEETEMLRQARKNSAGFLLTDNTALAAAAVVAGIAMS